MCLPDLSRASYVLYGVALLLVVVVVVSLLVSLPVLLLYMQWATLNNLLGYKISLPEVFLVRNSPPQKN